MTRRVYETDSYIREFDTVITATGTDDNGQPYAELEETVFFPEEGGQNADTGTLMIRDTGKSVRVTGGHINGDVIRYTLSEPVARGATVHCVLDWDIRYDRMQNHSGEHILTGVIHNKYGFDNVGFHLSDTGAVTLDLNGVISYEEVIEAERTANAVIYSDLPVSDSYPGKDELKDIDYRSKKEIDGQVRLITIGEGDMTVDVCACCAPHVRRTGEIGIIKVISVINWKGGIRISMLCGRRALEFINREHDILTEAARGLSTEASNVPSRISALIGEVSELKGKLYEALKAEVINRIKSSTDDEMRLVFVSGDYPAVVVRDIYNALAERYDGYCGVFAGDDDTGYRYNAGSRGKDSRELGALLKEKLAARGGGSADMIQGRIEADEETIRRFFREL